MKLDEIIRLIDGIEEKLMEKNKSGKTKDMVVEITCETVKNEIITEWDI